MIPLLVVPHILIAAYIIGINLIAATSELVGMITKQRHYDRFARNAAKTTLLLFAVGSSLAFTFILALITLYPGLFGLAQMIFINVVAAYMLTPSNAPATNVGWTFLNPTYMPLNMHRFVGNFSYAGFLIAGYAAYRYLRMSREEDREYYDWLGHWGIIWGFGFLLIQPFIGYEYMTEIKAHSPGAFEYLMLGPKSWLFNLLMIELLIMFTASVAYCLHKIKFAVKPAPRLRNAVLGALGLTAIFGLLNTIPADLYLVPQIGLVFGEKVDANIGLFETPPIPLGAMYPYKYIGLIGLAFVGLFALALYLKAAAGGFHWGRANRWSQY